MENSIKTQTEIKPEIIELLRPYYDITFKFKLLEFFGNKGFTTAKN